MPDKKTPKEKIQERLEQIREIELPEEDKKEDE